MTAQLFAEFFSSVPIPMAVLGKGTDSFYTLCNRVVFSENSIVLTHSSPTKLYYIIFIPEWKLTTLVDGGKFKIIQENHYKAFDWSFVNE